MKTTSLTVATFMKALIAAGFSNEEVFAAARAEFNLPASKKGYPAWYRCALRRDGVKV